jgi:hypothetical protein
MIPFSYPVADWCERSVQCKYEEDLPQRDVTPRWFEVSDGGELFSILRFPLNLEEYKRGGNLIDEIMLAEGSDRLARWHEMLWVFFFVFLPLLLCVYIFNIFINP